jgi:hypothetical protein
MQRDIPDDLNACLLRISMPATWNYVFAGLPTKYMSAKVEQQIKDKSGIRKNQESAAAYTVSNKTVAMFCNLGVIGV